MTKKRTSRSLLLIVISLLFLISNVALATEEDELIKTAGFIYKIKHPDNQIDKEKGGALNLNMTAGQKQTIIVEFENVSEEEIVVSLSLNGARTNSAGGLEYGPSSLKKDDSMQYDLPDLVSIPSELVLAPKSKKDLEVKVVMPEVPFDGIVTGGIEIQEKEELEEIGDETTIINQIAYLFGVTLHMTDETVSPELKLKKVYPEQINYRNAIFLDFANVKAAKVAGMMVDIEITKQNKSDVLYQSKKNDMEMAPNTVMSYAVSLNSEPMVAGKYTAHVTASADGKDYKWQKNFTITDEQADNFNQKDVTIEQKPGLDWKLVIIIVSLILIIILACYFGIKTKKKIKQSRRKHRK